MSIFNSDTEFYDLLEKQADLAVQAAKEFQLLGGGFGQSTERATALKRIEAQADELTHELTLKADDKFITPYDKEDMHSLSTALDDITDLIEAAGARVAIYRLATPRVDFIAMAQALLATVEATRAGVGGLRHIRDLKQMREHLIRIHDLENKNDEAYRTALGDLFNEPGADPLNVIKWKEIYDRIELVADKCESVAVGLERIVVKYG
ncbi:phosphate transport regulator [Capsulimonas corticalis]|uniref:Phosphate transport regulator n=1 Tax=Capsulimonas corticalis TaxID=2219043 RepID=A0A402D4G2_9BACT|nr:DUF47 family protein [Capsulimonas corticalis]BDI29136.1 phosphate transport regulator [Capsulimonas corticalis]